MMCYILMTTNKFTILSIYFDDNNKMAFSYEFIKKLHTFWQNTELRIPNYNIYIPNLYNLFISDFFVYNLTKHLLFTISYSIMIAITLNHEVIL